MHYVLFNTQCLGSALFYPNYFLKPYPQFKYQGCSLRKMIIGCQKVLHL